MPPIVRRLAGLAAVVLALVGVVGALTFVTFSHPALLVGVAGAFAAVLVLARVSNGAARLTRTDAAVLGLGLAAPIVAIAIVAPTFTAVDGPGTVDFSLRTAMKSDLRNLVAAEDAYLAERATYAGTLEELGTRFRSTEGVTISLVVSSGSLWATAQHGRTDATCAIFLGATPKAPAVREREPACTR